MKILFLATIFLFQSAFVFGDESPINSSSDSFEKRIEEENQVESLKYSFLAHRPFYILPLSYSFSPNKESLGTLQDVDNTEVKFQFSFKINIVEPFYYDSMRLSFAYTNLSFWQLYNKQDSAAFRETNHEPEVFLTYQPGGLYSSNPKNQYKIGFVHQSNGQVEQSRSWNRVYAELVSDLGFTVTSLKIWHRLHEKIKKDENDTEGDDNPDIVDFTGSFELRATSKIKGTTLSALWRNNLKKDNKGAVELSLSIPVKSTVKIYVQYFNGYGESLIDYDKAIQRVGVGVIMADWL